MAKAKVGLYLRYRQEGKQSPYRPVLWDAKKRLRPFWCTVRGVEEHQPGGSCLSALIKHVPAPFYAPKKKTVSSSIQLVLLSPGI